MRHAFVAELRKIFTIRSTYIICAVSFAILVFFAFYATGIKADLTVNDPNKLAGEATDAINALATIGAIVAVLLIAHEYRFNTIIYTLTVTKRRTTVFIAKLLAISLFALLFTAAAATLSPLFAALGIRVSGADLVPQVIHFGDIAWRVLYVGWGMAILAFILAMLIRIQVGAIVVLFFLPAIEQLAGLALKNNVAYLPYNALSGVLSTSSLSHTKSALVFGVYLVVGLIVSWILFLKRDAN